jgi:hypothetical protein
MQQAMLQMLNEAENCADAHLRSWTPFVVMGGQRSAVTENCNLRERGQLNCSIAMRMALFGHAETA